MKKLDILIPQVIDSLRQKRIPVPMNIIRT